MTVSAHTDPRRTAEDGDGHYVRDREGVWRYGSDLVAVPGAGDWVDSAGRLRIDAPELDLDPRVRRVAAAEATYRQIRGRAYEQADAARCTRNAAVRAALESGVTYARVAALTGLSRGRIALLRDPPSSAPAARRTIEGGWVRSAAFYQRILSNRRPMLSRGELDGLKPLEREIAVAQAELERRIAHYSAHVPQAFDKRAEAMHKERAAGLSARQIAEICDLSPKRVNEILVGVDYRQTRRRRAAGPPRAPRRAVSRR